MATADKTRVSNLKFSDFVLTNVAGLDDLTAVQGPPGQDGKDGFSPQISVIQQPGIPGGYTFRIKATENGRAQDYQVLNGRDGADGVGIRGDAGWTPVVTLSSTNSNRTCTMDINYRKIGINEDQPASATISWEKGSGGGSGSGLNLTELMDYFGKMSLIKPQNDDGRHIFLSASLYTDEQCNTEPIATVDTSQNTGRNCAYAFIGSTEDDNINAAWLPLSAADFNEGLGPEFDNYPIVIDMSKSSDAVYSNIIDSLMNNKRLYLKYVWYWRDSSDNSIHRSDTYSLVFPSITETGATARNKAESKKINTINGPDDDYDMYVVYPGMPNVIVPELTGDSIELLLADYSAENEYKVQFTVGPDDIEQLVVYQLDVNGTYIENRAATNAVAAAIKAYTRRRTATVTFSKNTKYFISMQLDMVTQFSSTPLE